MTDSIKKFYVAAFETSEIIESSFKRNIDIGDFDEYLVSLHTLTDVDIDKCNKLIKETIAWKDYFTDMDGMLDIYLDRFVYVRDCYEYLSGLLRDNKLVPKNLLTEYKIQSNTVADIIMELSNKTTTVNDKIQKIKIFSSYLNAYISYLNNVYFKLYSITKGYGLRYWRTID